MATTALQRAGGVLTLLVFPVMAGLALTLAAMFLSHLFVVAPLLAGLAVGAAAASGGAQLGLERAGRVGLAVALAAVAWLAWHAADYARFRADTRRDARIRYGASRSRADNAEALDRHLEAETGSPGFLGFLRLRWRHGIRSPLGVAAGPLLWALVALDALALAGAAAWQARRLGAPG